MASFLLTPILRIEAAASGKIEKNKIVHSTAMDTSTNTASRRFLNLFTLPGTCDAVLEKLDDGDARSLFATGVRPICKMIHEYVWSPKFDSQIGISQVPSPVSFCFLFKDDKYTIIVATNYWNSCTVMSIGGELFRHIGLLLKNPGAIVANGRDGFFVVDNDEKGSPPSIKAFQIHSITETETATAIVTEIAFVNPWTCRLEVPDIGRFWNPVSLTFARDQLVVASDGYHPPVESVSAWNPETGDFNSTLIVNPRGSGRLKAVLAIDSEHILMIDGNERGSYPHRLHRLRLRVLKWSDPAAQASVVYTTEMPCDKVDDISAAFMPLSDFAPKNSWTETGNIFIADGENNKLYVFSWHPNELDMILFKEVIVDSALLKEPSDIAYYKGVFMVLNTHRKCTSSRCTIPSGVYKIRVAAPCPPALAFAIEEK